MAKVEVNLVSVIQGSGPQYIMILKEVEGNREMAIVIGRAEAVAIIMHLNGIVPPRPMTHDLFVNTLSAFGIFLKEVVITKVDESIFYSELICEQAGTGTTIRIDSRTSDAIALAVRFNSKIFVEEKVLNEYQLKRTEDEEEAKADKVRVLKERIKRLKKRLQKAVEEERYEDASKIRDEIKELKEKLKNSDDEKE